MANMFVKAPYFASREMIVSDKMYEFFDLYQNDFMEMKNRRLF